MPGQELHLLQKQLPAQNKSAKALACYGLYLPQEEHKMLLRFVAGRPLSCLSCRFLSWICQRLAARGKKVLVLIWDNASWHISREVRQWLQEHRRKVRSEGGLRLLVCRLPKKSPWLNRIEPKWAHGKRAVVEPERVLSPSELEQRLCAYYGCEHLEHLQQ